MAKSKIECSTEFCVNLSERTPARILHVDDEPGILKVAKQCLEMEDVFQVDTATSVDEANSMMKKRAYDVVISDYMMPGKSGLDFLRALREDGKNVPFIIFTGKGREEIAVKALNLGADQYLNKIGNPETVYSELAHGVRKAIERKRASTKIRESEEKFRNIFENAGDAMIYLDASGKILDVNHRTVEIFGGSEKEFVGKHFTNVEVLSPGDIEKLKKVFEEGLAGKPTVINIDITNRKGQRTSLECHGSLLKISGETTVLLIGRDVTQSKRAEEGLRRSEEKYKALLEETPIGICNLDIRGIITYANKAFTQITGYSNDEIIGKSAVNMAHQSLQMSDEQVKPIIARIRNRLMGRKKSQPMTLMLRHKDGNIRWVEAESKLIKRFKIPVGLQAIIRDVTERREKERQIWENREKFEGLFMGNPEAAVYVSSDFRILDVNPCFVELFGYSLDEIKGKTLTDTIVPQNKIEEARSLDQEAREGNVHHDTVRKRKDGALIPVSISAAPITVKGQMIGYVALYKDISQLKSMERAVRETMERLVTMYEKLRVVGKLTRHDVRNKLSTVIGNVFLTKKWLSEDQECLDYLNEIESSVRQIEEIFEFAASYEKLGLEELDYMSVKKTIQEATKLLPELSKMKFKSNCDGLSVLADSLLRQLFYNLIDNSLSHGETVTEIRVCFREVAEDHLELIYEDNGVGIPNNEKSDIFLEGYGKSTGYGLYLIKKICEVYGWTIRETGKYKKGVQFTMIIPQLDKSGRIKYRLNHHLDVNSS